MENNQVPIGDSEKMAIYCRKALIESVDSLFAEVDLSNLAGSFADAAYYLTTPDAAKELNADSVGRMMALWFLALSKLSDVQIWLNDLAGNSHE